MKRIFLLLLTCCLALTSCSSDDAPALSPVGEVKFLPEETALWTGEKTLFLYFKTTEIYPCLNYPLLVFDSFSEGTLTVDFLGVGSISGCATALGPAEARIVLPENTQQLKLVQRDQTDLYTVVITGEKVELIPQVSGFSILELELLPRTGE